MSVHFDSPLNGYTAHTENLNFKESAKKWLAVNGLTHTFTFVLLILLSFADKRFTPVTIQFKAKKEDASPPHLFATQANVKNFIENHIQEIVKNCGISIEADQISKKIDLALANKDGIDPFAFIKDFRNESQSIVLKELKEHYQTVCDQTSLPFNEDHFLMVSSQWRKSPSINREKISEILSTEIEQRLFSALEAIVPKFGDYIDMHDGVLPEAIHVHLADGSLSFYHPLSQSWIPLSLVFDHDNHQLQCKGLHIINEKIAQPVHVFLKTLNTLLAQNNSLDDAVESIRRGFEIMRKTFAK